MNLDVKNRNADRCLSRKKKAKITSCMGTVWGKGNARLFCIRDTMNY